MLVFGGRGVCTFEAVSIEDRTFVKSRREAARMTPQLLRAGLLSAGTRHFNGDERHNAAFSLEHFIATKAALHYHRKPLRERSPSATTKAAVEDRNDEDRTRTQDTMQ